MRTRTLVLRCAVSERRRASARLRAMAAHPSARRLLDRCPVCARPGAGCTGCVTDPGH